MDTAQAAVRTYHQQQSVRLLSSPEQYYDVDDEVHRVRLRLPHLTTRDEEEKIRKSSRYGTGFHRSTNKKYYYNNTQRPPPHQLDNGTDPSSR